MTVFFAFDGLETVELEPRTVESDEELVAQETEMVEEGKGGLVESLGIDMVEVTMKCKSEDYLTLIL